MPSSGCKTCALDRKSTRLNSSHTIISYAVSCLKKNTRTATSVRRLLWGPASVWIRDTPHSVNCESTRAHATHLSPLAHPPAHPFFFFFNDTATSEISTLSLHDALPINDTATTEIYTLSLHDALPISVVAVS